MVENDVVHNVVKLPLRRHEEQGEECMEWIASCGALVESALRVGVAFGCGHELGHAVLMCAAALPMAGAPAMKGAGGTRTALSALPLAAMACAPRGRVQLAWQ